MEKNLPRGFFFSKKLPFLLIGGVFAYTSVQKNAMSFPFTRVKTRILVVASVTIFCHASINATDTPTPAATASPAASASLAGSECSFLLRYVSVQIPGGIRGLAPGTRITITSDLGDRVRVKADDLEFEVKKDHITHDPQMAMRASQVDTRIQQKLAESMAVQQQWIVEAQRNQIAQQEQIRNERNNLRELEERYRSLQQQEGEILRQIGQAQQRHPIRDSYGRHAIHYQPDQLAPQLPLFKSRLKDVQHEKEEARRRLEAAQRQR